MKSSALTQFARLPSMVAKGVIKVGVRVRVILNATLPCKTPAKAVLNLK